MAAPSPWMVGDGSGLRFPADANALRDGGIRFLTEAFHGYGSLPADELLNLFADEFRACGGPVLDVGVLAKHVVLYASVMGMTWLLEVPGYVRSHALTAESTRMNPAIRDVESVRCRLQMLTNVLNLRRTLDLGHLLDEFVLRRAHDFASTIAGRRV